MALAAAGEVRCYGESPEKGQFCIVPSLCVSEAHGVWVPAERLAAASAARTGSALPELVMQGLGADMVDARYRAPVRRSLDVLGLSSAEQLNAATVTVPSPAVMMSFYECGHLSHFLFNDLIPAYGSWLRLGARHDTVLIVEHSNECTFVGLLGALFNLAVGRGVLGAVPVLGTLYDIAAGRGSRSDAALMRLDVPSSLPSTPHCFGPSIIGSRGVCMHAYCPRAVSPMEATMLRGLELTHFGIETELPLESHAARSLRQQQQLAIGSTTCGTARPLRITVLQRAKSRVIVNIDAVTALLDDLQKRGRTYCLHRTRRRRQSLPSLLVPAANPEMDDADPLHAALAASAEFSGRFCGPARTRSHIRVDSPWREEEDAPGSPIFEYSVQFFEEKPLVEQMRVFAGTDVLLAVHGNALGHAMWMSHGAVVIEAFMEGWFSPWFRDPLTATLGLHHEAIQCDSRTCLPETDAQADAITALHALDPWKAEGMLKLRNVSIQLEKLGPALIRGLSTAAINGAKRTLALDDAGGGGGAWGKYSSAAAAAAVAAVDGFDHAALQCGLE